MSIRALRCTLLVVASVLIAACSTTDERGDVGGPVANAPTPAVGARWTYRGREGFRAPLIWEETHEVTAASAAGITVRVTAKGGWLDIQRQETFVAPAVKAKLAKAVLLRADVTANTPEDRALLKRFNLFGPPGLIFFDAQGRELENARVVGFQDSDRFAATLGGAGL